MARFFLQGKIISCLKILKENNMLMSPIESIRPDNLDEKVQKLVMVFRVHEIETKQKLLEKIKGDRHFLEK